MSLNFTQINGKWHRTWGTSSQLREELKLLPKYAFRVEQTVYTKQLQVDEGPGHSQPRGRQGQGMIKSWKHRTRGGQVRSGHESCLCLWWTKKQAHHMVISDTKYILVGLKTVCTQRGRPGNTKSRHHCFQLRKSHWQGSMDLCRESPLKAHRQRARPRVARKKVVWWYIPVITVLGREGRGREKAPSVSPAWTT